ncbi:MAG: MFS transporter [Candidatus Bathyarchaeota archaeon]|nr:MFS transporter [Candidatus Bathyarchaeota archaeon]
MREVLSKDLRLLVLSLGCRQMVMGCLQVMRTLYLYVIGFDLVAIGLLSMIGTIMAALRSVLTGVLADRYGKKPFLLLGGLFSTMRLLIYAFSADYKMLIAAQIIGAFGEGGGAGQPAVSGLIADKSPRKSRTRVFTIFAVTNASAAVLGSLLASTPKSLQIWLALGEAESFQSLFLICAVFSAVSSVFVLPVREEPSERRAEKKPSLLPQKSAPTISRFSLVRAVGGFGFGITMGLIGPWFKIQFGRGEEVIGPVYAISKFLVLLLYLSFLRIASNIDEVRTIFLSRLASAASILLVSFVPDYQFAAVLLVVYRVSLTLTMPLRQAFITTIVDPSERSSAIGISNLSRMSAMSLAPAIGGYIMETISMSLPFPIAAGTIALNGLSYHLFFGKTNQHKGSRGS